MEQETHYDVLGIDHQKCDLDDIKKAYRKLALQYHPDRVAPELQEEATETFQKITDAYEILSDGPKKLRYDNEMGLNKRKTARGARPPTNRGGQWPTKYPPSEVAEEPGNYFNKNSIGKKGKKRAQDPPRPDKTKTSRQEPTTSPDPTNFYNKRGWAKQDNHPENENKLVRIFKHKYCKVGIIVMVFVIFMAAFTTRMH